MTKGHNLELPKIEGTGPRRVEAKCGCRFPVYLLRMVWEPCDGHIEKRLAFEETLAVLEANNGQGGAQ